MHPTLKSKEEEKTLNMQQNAHKEENAQQNGVPLQEGPQQQSAGPVDMVMPQQVQNAEEVQGAEEAELSEEVKEKERLREETFRQQHEAFMNRYREEKDDRWGLGHHFSGNSEEMEAVKNSLRELTDDVLQRSINSVKDVEIQSNALRDCFAKIIRACDHYIEVKHPRYKHGRKRLQWVKDMREMCIKDKQQIDDCEGLVKELSLRNQVAKKQVTDIKVADLLWYSRTVTAKEIEGELEKEKNGNTTDVFKGDGMYFKEDKKTILDHIPDYMDTQYAKLTGLQKELDGMDQELLKQREKELQEQTGKTRFTIQELFEGTGLALSESRYERLTREELAQSIAFFQTACESLNEVKDKPEERDKLLKALKNFLIRDWNQEYEAAGDAKTWLTNTLDKKIKDISAELPEESMLRHIEGDLKEEHDLAPYKLEVDKEKHTARLVKKASWVEEAPKSYGGFDINNPLQEKMAQQVRKLMESGCMKAMVLTATGKEAELASQLLSRTKLVEGQRYARNAMASNRTARMLGQEKLLVTSITGTMTDTRTGKKMKGVFQSEAQGTELQFVIDEAEDYMKEHNLTEPILHYSTDAARQMMNLQILDLICGQTDRHYQNIKVIVDKSKKDKWVITKITAYDNDMSFGQAILTEGFSKVNYLTNRKDITNKAGHLYSMSQNTIKNSVIQGFMESRTKGISGAHCEIVHIPVISDFMSNYEKGEVFFSSEQRGAMTKLPNFRCMDKQFYERIENVVKQIGECNFDPDALKVIFASLGLPELSVISLAVRFTEVWQMIQDAKELAEADNRKFLLDQSDWDKLENLTDIAFNPGQSYLSAQDGDFFLLKDKEFQNYKETVVKPRLDLQLQQIQKEQEHIDQMKAKGVSRDEDGCPLEDLERILNTSKERYEKAKADLEELDTMEEVAKQQYNKQRQEVNLKERERKVANFNNSLAHA